MSKKRETSLEIDKIEAQEASIEAEDKVEPDTIASPKTKTVGEVNTIRLNVRANPSKESQVVKVIAEGEKVNIDLAKSTDDFYAIDDGFVMKQFITV